MDDYKEWRRRADWFAIRCLCAIVLVVALGACSDAPQYRLASDEGVEQLRFAEAREGKQ
jgi:hypothetical protein